MGDVAAGAAGEPPRRRGSLSTRLTILTTAATAAALAVLLLGVLGLFSRQLTGSVDGSLRTRAADLQAAIAESGPEAVEQEELAEVYDEGGTVVASSAAVRVGVPLLRTPIPCPGPDVFRNESIALAAHEQAQPVRVLARCLPGTPDHQVLAVAVSVEQQRYATTRLVLLLAVLLPLLLAAVALVVRRTVHQSLRPVDDLTRQAQRISAGADARIVVPASGDEDEIARLARTLQEMLGRLSVAFERESAFVDDAAHELRTPLAVLRGEIELALSDLDDRPAVEQSLRAAHAEAERLSRLADDLLTLARGRAGSSSLRAPDVEVDVRDLLDTFAARVERVVDVTVRVDAPDGLRLRTRTDPVERVLDNLVRNAESAGASAVELIARPTLLVGTGDSDDRPARAVLLVVADDGPGFPAGFLPSAFERFSRGDGARTRTSGAGLGLALVHALVHDLGGTVSADNGSPLGGAAVRVWLPATDLG